MFLALKNSPWEYETIKRYEHTQEAALPSHIKEWIARKANQKFDREVRLFVYLNTRDLWELSSDASKSQVEARFNQLFSPPDLSKATPFNCFFLRFYDFSPCFPFREISTAAAFEVLSKVRPFVMFWIC